MGELRAGQMLGPYQVIGQIGKGGMATVYRAYQISMERYVALKVLPREVVHDDVSLGRFKQEARLIARLEHPHILPVYDYGEHEGVPYLVMRYLEGGTLKERLQRGEMRLDEIDRVMTQLTDALAYAHERGIIHRDIKPSNVMLNERGDVFLTDFGIAKLIEGTIHLTMSGSITGTPAYMSPEQGEGRKLDQRTDIYSLGVMLYEMITGRVPFEAETPMAVILMKIQRPLPPPSVYKAGIHPYVEAVLLKSLARNVEDRYATMDDLLTAWKLAYAEVMSRDKKSAQIAATPPSTETLLPREEIAEIAVSESHIKSQASASVAVPSAEAHPVGVSAEVAPRRRQTMTAAELASSEIAERAPGRTARPTVTGNLFSWKWFLPLAGLAALGVIVVGGFLLMMLGLSSSGDNNITATPNIIKILITATPLSLTANAADFNGRGERFYEDMNWPAAIAEFTHAIELEPDNPEYLANRGSAYRKNGQIDLALADCEKAVALAPDYALGYYCRGTIYVELEKYDQAMADLSRAIELDPKLSLAYNSRGTAYSNQDKHQEALADYNKAIQLNPNFSWAYNNRGITYADLGEYDQAMADYQKAIELDPDFSFPYINRGRVYYQLEQYDQAIEDYTKAISLDAANPTSYLERARVYIRIKENDKAISDVNKALELAPDSAWAYLLRGDAYRYKGDCQQAIQDYTKAISIEANNAWAYQYRGVCYQKLEMMAEAQADFDKAEELGFEQ